MEAKQFMYDLEYQLQHRPGWRPAMSLGCNEQDAIRNFTTDYPPCFGTITAVRVTEHRESWLNSKENNQNRLQKN